MDIGSHCSVGACAQVDFLPFTCDCCAGVFCLQHRSYDAHECPRAGGKDRRVLQCPLCQQLVRWTAEQDVNEVWEAHVRSGACAPATAPTGEQQQQKKMKKKKQRCAADGCREVLLTSNSFHCAKCRLDVCLRHRFEGDHDCAARRQTQRRQHWTGAFSSASASSNAARASAAKPAVKPVAKPAAKATATGDSVTASSEQCPMCQRRFQYVSQLVAHVNREHPDPSAAGTQRPTAGPSSSASVSRAASETCPQCRAVFPDLTALIRHAEAAHAGRSGGSGEDKCTVM